MVALSTNYFTKVGIGTATTLAAPGHTIGGTTLNVVSTSNWPTDTGVIFAMDATTIVSGVETRTAGTYTEFEGVVTGATTIGSLVLRYGSDQNYTAGSATRVYIPVTNSEVNRHVDGILVSHNQDGTIKTGLDLGTPSALVLTNATGLPFAGLLSTIFSGQVLSQANAGTAGGTMHYINLGGIKLLWVITAVHASAAAGAVYTITLPTSFFSTIQQVSSVAINMVDDARQYVSITAATATTVTVDLVSPSGNYTTSASVLVIGT